MGGSQLILIGIAVVGGAALVPLGASLEDATAEGVGGRAPTVAVATGYAAERGSVPTEFADGTRGRAQATVTVAAATQPGGDAPRGVGRASIIGTEFSAGVRTEVGGVDVSGLRRTIERGFAWGARTFTGYARGAAAFAGDGLSSALNAGAEGLHAVTSVASDVTGRGFAATPLAGRALSGTESAPDDVPGDVSDELPSLAPGEERYVTLNVANGATWDESRTWRTEDARAAQAAYLEDTDGTVLALQEVDHHNRRSGNVNTAVDVIADLHPSFEAFESGDYEHRGVGGDNRCPADRAVACHKETGDGTHLYRTREGTLIFGEASTKQECSGAWGCRGKLNPFSDDASDAAFGNATFIPADHTLRYAYTEALPQYACGGSDEMECPTTNLFGGDHNQRLQDQNAAVRALGDREPRAATTAIVETPDGDEQAIINVHLSAHTDGAEARQHEVEQLVRIVQGHQVSGREVVLMGDFNFNDTKLDAESEALLEGAGLVSTGTGYDRVYVSRGVEVTDGTEVRTHGTSDHDETAIVTTE